MLRSKVSSFIRNILIVVLVGCLVFTKVFMNSPDRVETVSGVMSKSIGIQKQNNSKVIVEKNLSQDANIVILTAGGVTYTAKGVLEIVQQGKEQETVMELKGDISKKNTVQQPETTTMEKEENPIVITVYSGENIYGFYGNQGFYKNTINGVYTIILKGFLEGYTDGDKYYST